MNIITVLTLCISFVMTNALCFNPTSTCVDMTTVQSAIFQSGQYTTCNRLDAIPQLNCANSGNLCNSNSKYITTISCTNGGTDSSGKVIWQCTGNKPADVEFGPFTVSCEGCKYTGDPLSITGSCALFYQLVDNGSGGTPSSPTNNHNVNNSSNDDVSTLIIAAVVIIAVICIIASCASSSTRTEYRYTNVDANPTYTTYARSVPSHTTTYVNTGNSGYTNGLVAGIALSNHNSNSGWGGGSCSSGHSSWGSGGGGGHKSSGGGGGHKSMNVGHQAANTTSR